MEFASQYFMLGMELLGVFDKSGSQIKYQISFIVYQFWPMEWHGVKHGVAWSYFSFLDISKNLGPSGSPLEGALE